MQQPRDRIAMIAMMIARTGVLISAILGIGILFEIRGIAVMVHMLGGLLTILGVLVAAVRYQALGKGPVPMWASFALLVGGATISLGMWGPGLGLLHAFVMLVAVGLAEMGAARARRA